MTDPTQRLRSLADWLRDGGLQEVWQQRSDDDVDEALSMRDIDPFDSDWVGTNDAVQRLLREKPLSDVAAQITQDVARDAFLAMSGSPAEAPYVSDDFRLIAEAVAVDFESSWLAALLETYLAGELPNGRLRESQSTIAKLAVSLPRSRPA